MESEREISNGRWNGVSSSELLRDKVGDRYLWVTGYVKANHTCVPPRSITSSITNRDKLPTIFLFNGSYGYIIVSTKRYVASVPVLFLPTSHTRVAFGFARSRVKGKCFSLRGEREGAVFPSRFFSIRTARNTRRPPGDHGRSVKFT